MPRIFRAQMNTRSFVWFINIFLILIIFYNAELGRSLGIKGLMLPASVIWPATGISLGALLLFGNKVIPGVFFGNFLYNLLHLYFVDHKSISALTVAFLISFGSLAQAVVGGFIMRRYTSVEYFKTTRDIFIFLIPAGILTCFIAPTVGNVVLYMFHFLPKEMFFASWFTFWIGDTMGVYIFTPLIVVWSLQKFIPRFAEYKWETIGMLFVFVMLSIFTAISNLPLGHMFIPLSMWVTFRYRMHGATTIIFLTSLVTLIPTTLGYGTFIANLVTNQLIILVSLLDLIVAISLFLAALINDREEAWTVLETTNKNLRYAIGKYVDELKEMNLEVFLKERLFVHQMVTAGLLRQIQIPLSRIGQFTKTAIEGLARFKNTFESHANKNELSFVTDMQNNIEALQGCMSNVEKFEVFANDIVAIAQEHIEIAHPDRMKIQPFDIHELLDISIDQAYKDLEKRKHSFPCQISKEYDMKCQVLFPLPESLAYAFVHIFDFSLSSMKRKRDLLGIHYDPEIKIQTIDHPDEIEIVIWNNGLGATEEEMKHFFFSFVDHSKITEKSLEFAEKTIELGLSLAHDIITHEYRGSLRVRSEEGQFIQITIMIPKPLIHVEK